MKVCGRDNRFPSLLRSITSRFTWRLRVVSAMAESLMLIYATLWTSTDECSQRSVLLPRLIAIRNPITLQSVAQNPNQTMKGTFSTEALAYAQSMATLSSILCLCIVSPR